MSVTLLSSVTLSGTATIAATATQINIASNNWSTMTLSTSLVNGSTAPFPGREIDIYYLFSSSDLGATPATSTTFPGSSYYRIVSNGTASSTVSSTSSSIPVTGSFIYVWLAYDTLVQPVTLTVTANGSSAGNSIQQFYELTVDPTGAPSTLSPPGNDSTPTQCVNLTSGVTWTWNTTSQTWV